MSQAEAMQEIATLVNSGELSAAKERMAEVLTSIDDHEYATMIECVNTQARYNKPANIRAAYTDMWNRADESTRPLIAACIPAEDEQRHRPELEDTSHNRTPRYTQSTMYRAPSEVYRETRPENRNESTNAYRQYKRYRATVGREAKATSWAYDVYAMIKAGEDADARQREHGAALVTDYIHERDKNDAKQAKTDDQPIGYSMDDVPCLVCFRPRPAAGFNDDGYCETCRASATPEPREKPKRGRRFCRKHTDIACDLQGPHTRAEAVRARCSYQERTYPDTWLHRVRGIWRQSTAEDREHIDMWMRHHHPKSTRRKTVIPSPRNARTGRVIHEPTAA